MTPTSSVGVFSDGREAVTRTGVARLAHSPFVWKPPLMDPGESPSRKLDAFARLYLEQARAMTYAQLAERQEPPVGSLALGAAGLAYFFWRAARRCRNDALLEDAARWLHAVARAPGDPFLIPELGPRVIRDSVYFGPDGLLFAQILVAHARGERADAAARLFRARCCALAGAPSELLFGAAGYLASAQHLWEETGDTRFRAAAEDVAAALLRRQARWSRLPARGLAHGRAGVLRTLLRWSRNAAGRARGGCDDTVRVLSAPLARLAEEGAGRLRRARATPAAEAALSRTWCDGAAGMALLWAEAYAHEHDPRYAALARACGRELLRGIRGTGADLCCGHAGRGYALLAVADIDGRASWREAAQQAAVRAMRGGGPWPNGILKGYPGAALLAWDVHRRGDAAAFPLIG